MHFLNPGMLCLSCEATLCFASPSLGQAVQARGCVDSRPGCAGASSLLWFGTSVLIVMYFSKYSVLVCEVQRGYEGDRVTGRREISALEGVGISWVLEKCSLLSLLCAHGLQGKIKELPW